MDYAFDSVSLGSGPSPRFKVRLYKAANKANQGNQNKRSQPRDDNNNNNNNNNNNSNLSSADRRWSTRQPIQAVIRVHLNNG